MSDRRTQSRPPRARLQDSWIGDVLGLSGLIAFFVTLFIIGGVL